jgi:hypothetical protein
MNKIDWGQAVNNNTINWGQSATNNTINFGYVYENSPSGETELLGDENQDALNFRDRVINDSGTFEAFRCLVKAINF